MNSVIKVQEAAAAGVSGSADSKHFQARTKT